MPPHARYRAPTESGQTLAVPPWRQWDDLLAANLRWRQSHEFDLLGRPLAELVDQARSEVFARSAAYAAEYLAGTLNTPPGSTPPPRAAPVIVTGHQPGFVHPGVWVKNFAAAALASRHGGRGLHVVIDADVCRTPAMFVPAGTVDAPRLEAVEFDRRSPAQPWEERRILDDSLWRTFGDRVGEACDRLAPQRFLDEWWPTALERGGATGLIGRSLAQARHRAEVDWGCENCELPQSELCQTGAFQHFACTLLAELPRFVAAYNGVLADYRRDHGLRNHAHPVPDLARDGPWLEAPFWIWMSDDSHRRPLFARPTADGVLLADRRGLERLLPLTGARDVATAVEALADWESDGVKVRSRALITTMFTRLCVADLFIHGIGGAKYDEATDAICERFWGAAPPAYAALSGTLRLPIAHPPGDAADARRLNFQLRELTYHPERNLAFSPLANGDLAAARALAAEKSRWVRTAKHPEGAAERHRAIVAANEALQPFVARQRTSLEQELEAAIDRTRANRVLDSREFAFCLFPRKLLVQFLLDFDAKAL